MEHTVVNGSVHAGCTQHQRVCNQICVQICLRERGLMSSCCEPVFAVWLRRNHIRLHENNQTEQSQVKSVTGNRFDFAQARSRHTEKFRSHNTPADYFLARVQVSYVVVENGNSDLNFKIGFMCFELNTRTAAVFPCLCRLSQYI